MKFSEGLVFGEVEEFLVGEDDFALEFFETAELVAESGRGFEVLGGGGLVHGFF